MIIPTDSYFSEGLFHHQPEMAVEISLATRVWMFFLRNYWALDVPGLVRYSDDAGVSSVPPLGGELPTNPLGRLVLKLYHIVFYNKTIYIYIWYFIILYIHIYILSQQDAKTFETMAVGCFCR